MNKIDFTSLDAIKALCTINEEGCWNWSLSVRSARQGDHRAYYPGKGYVYRIAYELANGVKIEKSQVAMHLCNNSTCVNPAHIKLGTQAQNAADAARDGLMAHKLSDEQVLAILEAGGRLSLAGVTRGLFSAVVADIGDTSITVSNVRGVLKMGYNVSRVFSRARIDARTIGTRQCSDGVNKPITVEVITARAA